MRRIAFLFLFAASILIAALGIAQGAQAANLCCQNTDGNVLSVSATCEDIEVSGIHPLLTIDPGDYDDCATLGAGQECCCVENPDSPLSCLPVGEEAEIDGVDVTGYIGPTTIQCSQIGYTDASSESCAAGNSLCCCEEDPSTPGQCAEFSTARSITGTLETSCSGVSDTLIDTDPSQCAGSSFPQELDKNGDPTSFPSPVGGDNATLGSIIITFIRGAVGVLGLAALVMMVYGGFIYIFGSKSIVGSGDTKKKIELGKRTMLYSLIGLIVILLSFSIVNFLVQSLESVGK